MLPEPATSQPQQQVQVQINKNTDMAPQPTQPNVAAAVCHEGRVASQTLNPLLTVHPG